MGQTCRPGPLSQNLGPARCSIGVGTARPARGPGRAGLTGHTSHLLYVYVRVFVRACVCVVCCVRVRVYVRVYVR